MRDAGGASKHLDSARVGKDVLEPITERPSPVDPNRGAVFVLAPERSSELRVVRGHLPGGSLTEVDNDVSRAAAHGAKCSKGHGSWDRTHSQKTLVRG
jgi:hypothetical protein